MASRQNHWFENDEHRVIVYLRHIIRRSVYAYSAGFEDDESLSQLENLIARGISGDIYLHSTAFYQAAKRVIVDEPAECISGNQMSISSLVG